MGAAEAGLFEAHLLVLEDSTLLNEVLRKIRTEHSCAEAAFNDVFEKYVSVLGAVDDAYLRERAADLRDVAGRVLDHLSGAVHEHQLQHLSEPCILVAHDLAPSVTAVLDRKHVLGFATEVGGKTSHTAIMARKMGIPAVVGLGPLLESLQDGEYALLDGHGGILTLNPTDQTLFEYGQLKQRRAQFEEKLALLREQPAVTLDGHPIILAANIEGPEDMASVQASGANGIGLFRTEFLFLNRSSPPTEEEQFEAYRVVASQTRPGQEAIIRTLDLGGDKMPGDLHRDGEPNPFLGWRAIRISLTARNSSEANSGRFCEPDATARCASSFQWCPLSRNCAQPKPSWRPAKKNCARRASCSATPSLWGDDRNPLGGPDCRRSGPGIRLPQHRHQ